MPCVLSEDYKLVSLKRNGLAAYLVSYASAADVHYLNEVVGVYRKVAKTRMLSYTDSGGSLTKGKARHTPALDYKPSRP